MSYSMHKIWHVCKNPWNGGCGFFRKSRQELSRFLHTLKSQALLATNLHLKISTRIWKLPGSGAPPAGLNRYGPALIGELHVIGLLVPVWLTDHRESTHLDIKPEMPFTIKISNRNFPWEFFYPDVRGAGYEVSVGETYFFLVLALSRLPGRRFIGLIVIRKARVYQRVGLLFSRCISSQCWMKLGKRVPLVLEWLDVADNNGNIHWYK